jgi:predicted O-linked N-acetylglucosamine transferase (SPINDLY family)
VHGVQASKRILFLKHMSRWDYMNVLAVSDLFLDTANYGAHTTASDGMFGSLPIITRPGVTFSSRVAGSLNNAVQAAFLNSDSRRCYIDTAVEIATKPDLLRGLHERVKGGLGVGIFNSTLMSARLERVYLNLFDLYPFQYNLISLEQ